MTLWKRAERAAANFYAHRLRKSAFLHWAEKLQHAEMVERAVHFHEFKLALHTLHSLRRNVALSQMHHVQRMKMLTNYFAHWKQLHSQRKYFHGLKQEAEEFWQIKTMGKCLFAL